MVALIVWGPWWRIRAGAPAGGPARAISARLAAMSQAAFQELTVKMWFDIP